MEFHEKFKILSKRLIANRFKNFEIFFVVQVLGYNQVQQI